MMNQNALPSSDVQPSSGSLPGQKDSPGKHLLSVSERGKQTNVPSAFVCGRTVIVTGRWLKVVSIRDSELVEGVVVPAPNSFIHALKMTDLKADLFTFSENRREELSNHEYTAELDNEAVLSTKDYADWWENKIPQEARKNVRRAAKRGVAVRVVRFDDSLVRGIKEIYDETPVRQGRPFWHYKKTLEQVKAENGTYLERSEFIGAFLQDELIGFIKLIYVDDAAQIIQILSKISHSDKRPTNALLAKAVEVCYEKRIAFLIYGKYAYGKNIDSPLAEFKRRNGFEMRTFPKYYVPLSLKGTVALRLGLHRGLVHLLPSCCVQALLELRRMFSFLMLRVLLGSRNETTASSRSSPEPEPLKSVVESD